MAGLTHHGDLRGDGLRIAVVASRWNWFVGQRLFEGALAALKRCGVHEDQIEAAFVPGSFELPLAAKSFAESGRVDAVVALGVVIRGDTAHFDHVAGQAASGLMRTSMDTGVPVSFGVLTTETTEQAIDRAGGKAGDKGAEAAETAVLQARLLASIRGKTA